MMERCILKKGISFKLTERGGLIINFKKNKGRLRLQTKIFETVEYQKSRDQGSCINSWDERVKYMPIIFIQYSFSTLALYQHVK